MNSPLPKPCVTLKDYRRLSLLLNELTPREAVDLESRLDSSDLVTSHDIAPNVVTMNSRFRVKNAYGIETDFVLTYPDCDFDPDELVVTSPLGMAVLGLDEESRFVVHRASGKSELFQIKKVIYQPEAHGHWML